jgi:hypothetical protein
MIVAEAMCIMTRDTTLLVLLLFWGHVWRGVLLTFYDFVLVEEQRTWEHLLGSYKKDI